MVYKIPGANAGQLAHCVQYNVHIDSAGADPGFQVRGAHLKKLRRSEGGGNIFGVFRVKNHDLIPKNHIFSNFTGGTCRVCPPPWIRPCSVLIGGC
jgi:hypothetical protein